MTMVRGIWIDYDMNTASFKLVDDCLDDPEVVFKITFFSLEDIPRILESTRIEYDEYTGGTIVRLVDFVGEKTVELCAEPEEARRALEKLARLAMEMIAD